MANRGIYGQAEGNETRLASHTTAAHYDANHLVEGDIVATLRRMVGEQDWDTVTAYCIELKGKGHAQYRIDSMLNRATAGLKF